MTGQIAIHGAEGAVEGAVFNRSKHDQGQTKTGRSKTMGSPISHAIQGILGAGAFLAAQAATADGVDWMSAIERLGLAIALVAFFVWTGWQREQRMGKRIDYLKKQASNLGNKLAALTELVTEALKRDTSVIAEAIDTLHGRTCVACGSHEEFLDWQRKNKREKNQG